MTIAERFPYAALAAPLAPEERDRFASRLMGSRGGMTPDWAAAIAAYIVNRRNRARQG